jgi:two-component system LytT family sensor kinase
MNEPLLINSIGHSLGVLLFAGFLVLVLRDRRPNRLAVIAAALALLWNAGSLAVLGASSGAGGLPGAAVWAAFSFSVLSMLPAVLLHLALGPRRPGIRICGYILSGVAVILHVAELMVGGPPLHAIALWMMTIGFGALSLASGFGPPGMLTPLASMCLFLLSISFLHFGAAHPAAAWSGELVFHHAGIPLALYVLLQDYRFLLLDAFLRFVVNSALAGGTIGLGIFLNVHFHLLQHAAGNPFLEGLLIAGSSFVLILLVALGGRLQLLLTRKVFRRPDREPVIAAINDAGAKAGSEQELLRLSARLIGGFIGAEHVAVVDGDVTEAWAETVIPLRFAKGDESRLLLGRRQGGRLYLSEDLQELTRLGAVVVEEVERLRHSELQRLVSQAELRALQSQINPHFLFNALNTLYGTIPRQAADARRITLDLAEIFRYFLQTDRGFIPLAEEMKIVRAYLEIEALRLGDRLHTEIEVDPAAEPVLIPVLSIQPLVENAVKHGIAGRASGGSVRLAARTTAQSLIVEVTDDGGGFVNGSTGASSSGGGVGLDNVRKRLHLYYGDEAGLRIESSNRGSTVAVQVPRRTFLAGQGIPA